MTLAIASQKGGVGKTTTAVHIAAGLAHFHNKKVLLIDMDSQANSSKTLLPNYKQIPLAETVWTTIIDSQPIPIHPSNTNNLYVSPSNLLMSEVDIRLTSGLFDNPGLRLQNQMAGIEDDFDHIIIDCPPSLSYLTINAFACADKVIVPITPGWYELDAIAQISRIMDSVRSRLNPSLELKGFLLTLSDTTNATKETVKLLQSSVGASFLKTRIPKNTAIRDALLRMQTIYEYDISAPSAGAYRKLIREVYGYDKA